MNSKIINKIYNIFFKFFFKKKFFQLGSKSYINFPFRIDGSNHISIGDNTYFQKRLWIYVSEDLNKKISKLNIGSNCVFGYNNHISTISKIEIEDYVLTANNVFISDNIHSYENINIPIVKQGIQLKKSVKIGFGTWIGENVCIIGANIGKNCVIGANSVITKDVQDYSIVVGSPGRVIKYYDINLKKWIKNTNHE